MAKSGMSKPWLGWVAVIAIVAAGLTVGCGVSFATATPPGFVELNDQGPLYDYRAVSSEGVVIGVREIEHDPKGDDTFWVSAIRTEMREKAGYSLLGEKKVSTRSGLKGTQLKFGRDEDGEPMLYDITVFVTEKYIFLLEFGGAKNEMTRQEARLTWVIENFRKK